MSEVYDATKQIAALKALPAYRFLTESEIPEIRAVGVTMEHVKTPTSWSTRSSAGRRSIPPRILLWSW